MTETWRPVAGWEGLYEVSDQGRVRSLPRLCRLKYRPILSRGGFLKGRPNDGGYLSVALMREGTRHNVMVHTLVLEAFIGAWPDGLEACHNDGDPTNNSASNLRWDTHSSNLFDQSRHGTNVGRRRTVLTPGLVRELRAKHSSGVPVRRLAHDYGLKGRTVRDAIQGLTWRHVEAA